MNYLKLSLVILAVVCVSALLSRITFADDAPGTVSTQINTALTLTQDIGMSFANISPLPSGDRIILTTDNRTVALNGSILSGVAQTAQFSVTGSPNAALSFAFSTPNFLTGPGQSIRLQSFRHDAGTTPALDGGGVLSLNIGADILINPAQALGVYSGIYNFTVEYL